MIIIKTNYIILFNTSYSMYNISCNINYSLFILVYSYFNRTNYSNNLKLILISKI